MCVLSSCVPYSCFFSELCHLDSGGVKPLFITQLHRFQLAQLTVFFLKIPCLPFLSTFFDGKPTFSRFHRRVLHDNALTFKNFFNNFARSCIITYFSRKSL